MKKLLTRTLKAIGYTFIALFIYGFSVGVYQGVTGNNTVTSPPPSVAKPLSRDPVLVGDAGELGIDSAKVNFIMTSQSITQLATGKTTETTDGTPIGLFIAPNTIYIESGLDKDEELNILAYEYMHYIWANLSSSDKQSVGSELDAYKTQNADYNTDVSRYHGDIQTIQDEEDSTACTRVDPSLLSDSFNAYCNQSIPNRSILF